MAPGSSTSKKKPADAKGMKSLFTFFGKKPPSTTTTKTAANAATSRTASSTTTTTKAAVLTPKNTNNGRNQDKLSKQSTPETDLSSQCDDDDDSMNVEEKTKENSVGSNVNGSAKATTNAATSSSTSKQQKKATLKKRKVIVESDEEEEEEWDGGEEAEEEKKCEEPPPRKKAAVATGQKAPLPTKTNKGETETAKNKTTNSAKPKSSTAVSLAAASSKAKSTGAADSAPPASKAASAKMAWGAMLNGSFKKAKKRKSNAASPNNNNDDDAGTSSVRNLLKRPYTDGDDLPILSEPQEFFDDMIQNQLCENGSRPQILTPLLETLQSHGSLKIATMCSGTESPILALDMIVNSIESFLQSQGTQTKIRLKHVFSCEIEPAKQAYIERNFQPPLLFRDIRELGDDQARTAYGALVDVPNKPGCVDILVAGTSCVDYSNLNTNKKELEDGGESGQTFQGMLKWIDKAQPPFILLENVVGAPWDKMIELMETYGYAATYILVDSKKYYIPHTRQRGYLFAIRRSQKKAIDMKRLDGWKNTMKNLERPASAPLDALMLPNDDPRVQRGRARLTQASSNGGGAGSSRAGQVDWSKCEARHVRARVDEGLGEKRSFTNWSDSGKTSMPYWGWNDWLNAQVHRVHDVIDINTLRLAQFDVDLSFKNIVMNVSQNVDRDTMGKMGLTSCLTPSGIFFVTSRGGPLVGEELLLLQGIPADDLLLTKESEDILKDMAGNAMSSTLVGACILSALLHGHDALKEQPELHDDNADESIIPSLVPRPLVPASEVNITQDFGTYENKALDLGRPTAFGTTSEDLSNLLAHSWLSSRKCVSEGVDESAPFEFIYECTGCGQTAHHEQCFPPRQYEEHKFMPIKSELARIQPSSYRKELLDALPMQVAIANLDISSFEKPDHVGEAIWNSWKDKVACCLPSREVGYRFTNLERTHIWKAHYVSVCGKARLELQINKKSAEWQVFTEAPQKRGVLRDILERPVARMKVDVSSGSFMAGRWELNLPTEEVVTISIEAAGVAFPSWKSKLGLKRSAEEVQFEKLIIKIEPGDGQENSDLMKRIEGTYWHEPKCGSAIQSLHKKETGEDEEAVYFFFESGRRTLPEDDVYVFAPTRHRTAYKEQREIFLAIDKQAKFRHHFEKCPDDSEKTRKVKARVPGKWVPLNNVSIQPLDSHNLVSMSIPATSLSVPVKADGWKHVPEIIACDVPLDESDELLAKCSRVAGSQDINLRKSKHVLRHLSFATSRFELPEAFRNEAWIPLDRSPVKKLDGEDPVCTRCSPSTPRIQWTVVTKQKKRVYIPVEDWRDAAAYEAALKSRPNPWTVRLSAVDASETKALRVQIGCNAFSLCQRAFGRLPSDLPARKAMIQMSDKGSNCTYEFRIVPHLEKGTGDFAKLRFTSNKKDAYAPQPTNFKLELRPEQQRSLSWMLQQELSSVPFFEEEVAEAILPDIEWRAEGRVRRPVLARAGIIADEVGYGKTCCALSIIDSNQRPMSEIAEDAPKGTIPTKATLIVVPGHLIGQWPGEIKKFLGNSKKVLTIKDMTSFNKTTIDDVQEADIVLVNFTVLTNQNYYERLARLAGKSEKSVTGNQRHFEAVYCECLASLPNRVEQITKNSASVFEAISSDAERCRKAEDDDDVNFRLDGKKAVYKNTSERPSTKPKMEKENDTVDPDPWNLKKAAVKKDYKNMTCPPLECFFWHRLVVDEFTYLLEKPERRRPLCLVRKLSARYRWFLSGTPCHENFDDIKLLAELIGIFLGEDELLPGAKVPKSGRKSAESATGLEHLSQFSEVRSFQWHERRHAKAQEFLDRFVRQNIAEIDEIPYKEHEEIVQLSSPERAIYLELETVLRALEMNHSSAKLSKKKSQSDRENRMQAILRESSSAEEALLKCASSFSVSEKKKKKKNETKKKKQKKDEEEKEDSDDDSASIGKTSALTTCQDIIDFRTKQKDELEQEMVKFIAAALRQRNRIDAEQEGWSSLTKTDKGEMLDAVGHYLRDVEGAESISHGADDDLHSRVKELVILAQVEVTENPGDSDDFFAAANSNVGGEGEDDEPAAKKRKKSECEDMQKERLFNMKLELRNHVHRIRSLGKELCGRVRSLRYIEQIRAFQHHGAVDARCPGCNCGGLSIENAGVLSCCGHVGCLSCLMQYASDGNCVNHRWGCSARAHAAHVVPAKSLGTDENDSAVGPDGAKLTAIVRKVKEIIAENDRIIIFVQFDDLKDLVMEALNRNNIKSVQVKGTVGSQIKALEPFQKETPTKNDPRVLLLKMDSESAAGLNLTMLNHAIFVHPLLAGSQQQYEAYETQAIGRIRRYGQLKHVHVWRFLVSSSIDTEIFEQRTGRAIMA